MSYHGQSKGIGSATRHNAAFAYPDNSTNESRNSETQGSVSAGSSIPANAQLPFDKNLPNNQPIYYHHHRGHKRGHSYGGPVSPAAAAFHHARLEARPSHPNTHHGGTLPSMPSHTVTNTALLKGHRRALSGCMPMGMGVVAWTSLRELQSPTLHGLRSRSPIDLQRDFASSPEKKRSLERGIKKPPPTDDFDALDGQAHHLVECGLGPFSLPKSFHVLANIKFFVAILALLVTFQQAIASGYVSSVITTIEIRFEIPSKFTGLIASSYEMGNVVTVLFVSYLGAKRHIPRWIGCGVLVMVIGCVVFTLPHFLSPISSTPDPHIEHNYYTPDYFVSNTNNTNNGSIRLSTHHSEPLEFQIKGLHNHTSGEVADIETKGNLYLTDSPNPAVPGFVDQIPAPQILRGKNSICHSTKRSPPKPSKHVSLSTAVLQNNQQQDSEPYKATENDDKQSNSDYPEVQKTKINKGSILEDIVDPSSQNAPISYGHPLILFMLAQILLGCGGSPLFTLGITFVDDHVSKDSSSIYIGVIYSMAAFGPVLGFLTGAWLLLIPASPSSPLNSNGQFIGMWWGGFLIVGALLFVTCLPFLTFPKLLHKNSSKSKEAEFSTEEAPMESSLEITDSSEDEASYGQSIKDIPRSMWKLIKKPAYIITCLAGCMEMNIISGVAVFIPKYLETQFGMGRSEASAFTGGIAMPGVFIGILTGAFVMKRLQLSLCGAAKFVVITNCICLLGHSLFFFLGCNNPNLAGATVPYPGSIAPLDVGGMVVNLTNECNMDCSCDSVVDAQYVCHNHVTYFSPCHAGCTGNFTQCSCAEGGDVTPGVCPESPCNTLAPFMAILFFMTAGVAMTLMPLLMIVLRSVSDEERSFALGMQFVLYRILGYIPSPIIFGNVIDSACMLWSVQRTSSILHNVNGRCLLYDIVDFRFKYVGMLTGFKLMGMLLFMYNFFQLRKLENEEKLKLEQEALDETNVNSLKGRSNSVYSLDKLFEDGTDTEQGGSGEGKVIDEKDKGVGSVSQGSSLIV